jgi:hypothetical protein
MNFRENLVCSIATSCILDLEEEKRIVSIVRTANKIAAECCKQWGHSPDRVGIDCARCGKKNLLSEQDAECGIFSDYSGPDNPKTEHDLDYYCNRCDSEG